MEIRLAAKIDLSRPPETEDERYAVRQLKGALNRLGYYTPDEDTGMNSDIDDGLKDSVYAYQRKSTIFFDDIDLGPGSTTERILNDDLDYMDRDYIFSGAYIWRTVGDEKVRGPHALRSGKRFLWGDPPEGGHPSEDYNCRCWAEPVAPPYHPWIEWVNKRREERLGKTAALEKLAPSKGLNVDLVQILPGLDEINPTWSPFDFIGGGAVSATKFTAREIVAQIAAKQLAREAAMRDVSWIKNAPKSQLQKKFKHADIFGVKGNQNNKTLEAYKKALENHVRSPNTIEKSGKLHNEPVTHYYDPKTHLNVIRDSKGNFKSAWKLKEEQINYMKINGNLGGGKK
ncbi:MAG: hypothetical protein DI551_05150 [Micavibrio aeruginosavorus]|uniref:Phage head morphogenesis domain-containing protein n=1 Tax=Micavibrio aeruginosavorus TaxID=349221 RepID=A0A2W5N184_9BACT|nr:MAG: hypothetical protein DI551_05150 [Micavibrio aeruginosavorus]